jgi:hypothetical protein
LWLFVVYHPLFGSLFSDALPTASSDAHCPYGRFRTETTSVLSGFQQTPCVYF